MAKRAAKTTERKTYAVIRSGRKKEEYETWRAYSIINALRSFGAERTEAYSAEVWQRHAAPGEQLEVEPGITLEIIGKEVAEGVIP